MSRSRGFSLIETLIATALLGFAVLAVAPMFVQSMKENKVGSDVGTAAAAATARMEQLRELSYDDPPMAPGGSLTSDVAGYFDDSDADFLTRWEIAVHPTLARTRSVTVRTTARRSVVGEAKQAVLFTLRGDS